MSSSVAEELECHRHAAERLEGLWVLGPQVGEHPPAVDQRALAAGGLVHEEVQQLDARRPVVARQVGVRLQLERGVRDVVPLGVVPDVVDAFERRLAHVADRLGEARDLAVVGRGVRDDRSAVLAYCLEVPSCTAGLPTTSACSNRGSDGSSEVHSVSLVEGVGTIGVVVLVEPRRL